MIWSPGLLHLTVLVCFNDPAQLSQAEILRRKLQLKLQSMHVYPAMYTWPRFSRCNAVYMKQPTVDWRRFHTVESYR